MDVVKLNNHGQVVRFRNVNNCLQEWVLKNKEKCPKPKCRCKYKKCCGIMSNTVWNPLFECWQRTRCSDLLNFDYDTTVEWEPQSGSWTRTRGGWLDWETNHRPYHGKFSQWRLAVDEPVVEAYYYNNKLHGPFMSFKRRVGKEPVLISQGYYQHGRRVGYWRTAKSGVIYYGDSSPKRIILQYIQPYLPMPDLSSLSPSEFMKAVQLDTSLDSGEKVFDKILLAILNFLY